MIYMLGNNALTAKKEHCKYIFLFIIAECAEDGTC